MKTINYISKYAFSALIFGVVLVSMPLNTISAEMECSLGRTAVTMTNDKSGKTRVLCLPDQAVSGIENAADHSAIEISASCPCWTEEDIKSYNTKYPSMSCESNTTDSGTTCYSGGPTDPKARIVLAETLKSETISRCTDHIGGLKSDTSALEHQECDALLTVINPYGSCPCWSEKELADIYNQKQFVCGGSAGGAVDCYLTGTNTLFFHIALGVDVINACINNVNGDGIKQAITDTEYKACGVSLVPYKK